MFILIRIVISNKTGYEPDTGQNVRGRQIVSPTSKDKQSHFKWTDLLSWNDEKDVALNKEDNAPGEDLIMSLPITSVNSVVRFHYYEKDNIPSRSSLDPISGLETRPKDIDEFLVSKSRCGT